MKLVSFQVWNFRSINKSGSIDVSRITSLVGRNESGKTNLLLALKSLNPPEGLRPLNRIKDFPRHKRLEECDDNTRVLETSWELGADESAELEGVFPRAKGVKTVTIGRSYGTEQRVGFKKLPQLKFDKRQVVAKVKKIVPVAKAAAQNLEEAKQLALNKAIETFQAEVTKEAGAIDWANASATACVNFRQAIANAGVTLPDAAEVPLDEIDELAETINSDDESYAAARRWAIEKLPIFIYLEDYPELRGHQNIAEYLRRKREGQLDDSDRNFEKLCKVAGLKPEELDQLSKSGEQETRNQLANRASAVVTNEIRRLWKDRALKIRFNLDAEHMDTLVSDPTAVYDVEVNLNERSRGFKWFFSFYMAFSADTRGGAASNAILLLDEPGLYLHAMSQRDLLRHFYDDFDNQILYTTHSPFMVPTDDLAAVRTVSIGEDSGTTVTNDPSGDARTLFPLQHALGYSNAQSMFIGPCNMVVEGVTDYWIISSISEYLTDQSKKGLNEALTITPSGGAQKVSYMVALLTSEELSVLVLLDSERQAEQTKDDLVKAKLIREDNVLFVASAFDEPISEADIEDVLDPAVYEALVNECYAKELKGKSLSLNPKIPRIAKRYEAAFDGVGLEFHKTRPARLLLNKMASAPADVMTALTAERFERLFEALNASFEKHIAKDAKPFK